MIYSSISAVGSFTDVNTDAPPFWFVDPARCSGGDGPDLRSPTEAKSGTDGVMIFPRLDDAWVITLGGPIVGTGDPEDTEDLIAALKAALDAMKATPDALVHPGGSLDVMYHSRLDVGWDGGLKVVTFGLIVVV